MCQKGTFTLQPGLMAPLVLGDKFKPLSYLTALLTKSEMPICIKIKCLTELGKRKPEKVLRKPSDF